MLSFVGERDGNPTAKGSTALICDCATQHLARNELNKVCCPRCTLKSRRMCIDIKSQIGSVSD